MASSDWFAGDEAKTLGVAAAMKELLVVLLDGGVIMGVREVVVLV